MRKVMYGGNARRRTADKETSTYLNTPGRLRARSGSKLPAATGPLRALGMVDCRGQNALPWPGCLQLSAGCCVR